jgi:PAS domain S-box-containing protein
VGVVVESQEGVVQLSNPAFRKMFGYSNEDIAGKSIDQLVATGELRQEAEAISRQVHSGWSFHRILKRTRKDGSLLDVEAFAAALAAHTLKGMFRNLAMNAPAELASTLENAARENNLQQATSQLPVLANALSKLMPEVESQLTEVRV